MRSVIVLPGLLLSLAAFAQETFEVTTDPRVRVETSSGDFVIELDRTRAPLTVQAFLDNITSGFYAGTVFHRVVSGFVAQGGYFIKIMVLVSSYPPAFKRYT